MKTQLILQNKHFNSLLCELKDLEKDRIYCNHQISHLVEVARIMLLINSRQQLNIPNNIIIATALLHDIGRVNQYKYGTDHRVAGISDINNILTECNYSNEEISTIINAIKLHNNSSNNTLANLLYKADKLSRPCYCCKVKESCKWEQNLQNKCYYK